MNLATLNITKLIIHDVPRKGPSGGGPGPTLTDIECDLTPTLRNYFTRKIVESLSTRAVEVFPDPSQTSPVPGLIGDHFGPSNVGFVEMSQSQAKHLDSIQTAVNSAGLLCVAESQLGAQDSLCILKLEREGAVNLELESTGTDGGQRFKLQQLTNLVLSETLKVFKVGAFVQNGETLDSISGWVSDNQRGYSSPTEVADFFLRKFLGFKLRIDPKVLTQELFTATEQFINEAIIDRGVQADYTIALLAEMNSAKQSFDALDFATEHMTDPNASRYLNYLEDHDLVFSQPLI